MTEEWRRVGEKRGEGTVNWLEPRSQGRVAGGVGQGNCKRSQDSRPVSRIGGDGGAYSDFVMLSYRLKLTAW